MLPSLLAKH
ncbi:hypothetical protein YPPY36_4976, partial [Yersinia pestis PY-36]